MNMYVCVQDSLITIRLASAGVGKKKTQIKHATVHRIKTKKSK